MKGHSDVMQDDTENNMFKDLLGDYAEPSQDNGFSDLVMASLPGAKTSNHLKSLIVGGAGALGAVIAGSQLPGLWNYVTGVNVPNLENLPNISEIQAPAFSLPMLDTSYGMVTALMIGLTVLWLGQSLMFGDDA